jgi:hypothetical protein
MTLAHCILGKFLGVVCLCFPLPLDTPTFTTRCLYVPINVSSPSSERWNCGREWSDNFAEMTPFLHHSGIFYMPQICDMGQMALLPFQRKACWGFFHPKNPTALARSEPTIWVPEASVLTTRPLKPHERATEYVNSLSKFIINYSWPWKAFFILNSSLTLTEAPTGLDQAASHSFPIHRHTHKLTLYTLYYGKVSSGIWCHVIW